LTPPFNILVNNQFGSAPNHLPEVQLRGSANLPTITDLQDQTNTDLNTPLIILDGFEITLTRMMDLNTEEVESITLLKDGSATAIYGSRGANGVIVITRRAPQAGKLQFTYTGSLNLEVPDLTGYHLLDAAQKLELERRSGYYDSSDPTRDFKLKQKYASLLQQVERGVDTDWKSKPLRTGVGQRHSIRLEGGDDSFRYSVSLQYNDVEGVMKGSDRESFNGGVTLSYSHRNFLFTNDLNIGHTKSDESPYGTFSDYTRLNPYWRAYDDDGNIINMLDTDTDFFGGRSNLPGNPLYNAQLNQTNSNKYTDITNNFSIEWRPFDGMITRGRVGLTWRDSETDDYKPAKHTMFEADEYQTAEGILRKGRYNYGTGKVTNYDIALTASYSKLFAEKHLLYTAANWNLRSDYSRNYSFAVEGFADETLDFLSSALQYEKGGKPSGGESKTHSVGLVLNANYAYDNRYYTDLAYRLDGSSQFGRNKRFAPFFSVGVGWNVHNEKFMKNVKFINRLKVRGSFGQTGSQKFSAYQAVATYAYYLSDRYGQWVGAYQKALENPDLEWQKTDKWNVGVEMDLLDRRLSLTADLYYDKTSNLLSSLDLPLSNGFTSYIENIGEVENKGFELKATAFIVRNDARRLAWSVTGALVHNTDKVVKLSEAMKDEYTKRLLTNSTLPNKVIREGESQNTIYAVPSLGIDPSTGYELFLKKNGEVTYTWDAADRVACGVSEPKYRGTLSSLVRWRDFSATVSFGYRFGGQIYNSTLADRIENADKHYNVDERVFNDRWQNVGDHALFKGLTDETTTYATTRFVQDERTLTCQNIHLSYMFSRNPWLLHNLGIQTMTLSSDLSDLFYISTVKQERGLSYPYSRRFSLSLTVTF
jgi:Outer membrane receptor proteins, mostly Fe transport